MNFKLSKRVLSFTHHITRHIILALWLVLTYDLHVLTAGQTHRWRHKHFRASATHSFNSPCATLWRHQWSITEQTYGNIGICLLKIVSRNDSNEQILTVTIRPSPSKIFGILIQKSSQDLCFTSLRSTLEPFTKMTSFFFKPIRFDLLHPISHLLMSLSSVYLLILTYVPQKQYRWRLWLSAQTLCLDCL